MSKIDANLDRGDPGVLELDGTAIRLLADSAVTGNLTVSGSVGAALATVADPGDGLTIVPPTSGADFSSAITTGGASETRVLGTPARLGQKAFIVHSVDGGDFSMTNASGWKGGGTSDDVATFSEVEDTLVVIAVGTAAVTDWRFIADKAVVFA